MATNEPIQDLMQRLIACDEQPSDRELSNLRQQLQQKVVRMKVRSRYSAYAFLAGVAVALLGVGLIMLAADGPQDIRWLTLTGFCVVVTGAIVQVAACVGLLLNRGFGFVWAQNDLQEAALMELSMRVQQLSDRVDALSTTPPTT